MKTEDSRIRVSSVWAPNSSSLTNQILYFCCSIEICTRKISNQPNQPIKWMAFEDNLAGWPGMSIKPVDACWKISSHFRITSQSNPERRRVLPVNRVNTVSKCWCSHPKQLSNLEVQSFLLKYGFFIAEQRCEQSPQPAAMVSNAQIFRQSGVNWVDLAQQASMNCSFSSICCSSQRNNLTNSSKHCVPTAVRSCER